MAKRSTVDLDADEEEEERRKVRRWTREEEVLLCKCWVEVFENNQIGADQNKDSFWGQITNDFNQDAHEPLDADDHTELSSPNERPRLVGKPRPAKKTKSETTESNGGSHSGSISECLSEDLRRKMQAASSAYESKKAKELAYMECKELEFLMIDAKGQRCFFLDHSVHQPCVLSEAHLAYFLSLENGGVSLHRFFDVHSHAPPVHSSSSPVLNLPQTRKGHTPVDHHDNEGGVLSIWIWDFLIDVLLLFMNGKDEQTVEKHLIAKLFTPVPEEIEGYGSSLNDKEDASFWYMQVNASTCDELDDFEEFGAIYDDGDVDEFLGGLPIYKTERKLGKGEFGRVYVGRRVTGVSGRTALREGRPKLTFFVFIMIMLLGLLKPVVDQNLFCAVLKYITATFAVAMGNIIPATTFLITWVCRLEKANIKKIHSIGKIVGTLVTVGGAMIMTLVARLKIGLPWTKVQPM
ncbi:WAT1-related protein [Tanacetum coccineum]